MRQRRKRHHVELSKGPKPKSERGSGREAAAESVEVEAGATWAKRDPQRPQNFARR